MSKVDRRAFLGKLPLLGGMTLLPIFGGEQEAISLPAKLVKGSVERHQPGTNGERKTEAELLERLRDNITGNITARDIRNIVVTMFSEVNDLKGRR